MRTIALRAAALVLCGVSAFAARPAAAQELTGVITAHCQTATGAVQVVMKYTAYRDAVVWMNQHGLGASATDMRRYGTIWWEGYAQTGNGRYVISGENGFIEARPQNGVYSDTITYQIINRGRNSFILHNFYSRGPDIPCQVVDMR